MIKKITKIGTIIFCIMIITSTIALAATTTLMSYSGSGIRSKASVQNFNLSKECCGQAFL